VPSRDPVQAFEHDHQTLNEQVLALGPLMARFERDNLASTAATLAGHIAALRDDLFLHFAREEEGLFPYLAANAPDLEPSVAELVSMHDEICGALARLIHVVNDGAKLDSMAPLFDRFESAYVRHSRAEHALLETAAARLTPAQRDDLAAMVAGI
jgi:DUF438 domain-containing protein